MIAIIIDNHVHRLLKNGAVESAELIDFEDFKDSYTLGCDWKIRSPENDLNINSGDFDAFVRKNLEVLCEIFPAGRKPLPSSEKKEQSPINMSEPR